MGNRISVGRRLVKVSSLYLMIGLLMGLIMGISHSYTLVSQHSHTGLLGWVTMALTGLVYVALPRCDGNRFAHWHFWLLNLGLPVMIAGLVWEEYGGGSLAEVPVGIGSFAVVAASLLFTINVLLNVGKD